MVRPTYRSALISELSQDELECYAIDNRYPKWNSLCALRLLGMPVLDSAFIPPLSEAPEIAASINALLRRSGSDRVMMRSDGGRETKIYHRGGNSYQLPEATIQAEMLSRQGRAVIFFEPTNRFDNRFSINIIHDVNGICFAEILGGGYDASDLNRGGVLPAVVVRLKMNSEGGFQVRYWDIESKQSDHDENEARRLSRLLHLGEVILPNSAVNVTGDPAKFAENWLHDRGYNRLWDMRNSILSAVELKRRFEDGLLLYHWVNSHRRASTIVLSGSRLGDNRFVYWDFIDASQKWAWPLR